MARISCDENGRLTIDSKPFEAADFPKVSEMSD